MNWKKLVRQLLFPHPALVCCLLPAALSLLIYSAVTHEAADVISIVSYVLSFYGLLLAVLRVPAILRFAARFKRENRYVLRYTSDVQLRMNISLYAAFGFNAVYAAFQLGLGMWHHSVWFYAMAGYYLILAVMRMVLIRHIKTHVPGEKQELEWRKYRLCGAMLMTITFALAIFIAYFVFQIRVFKHHEITTITMAAYTFASLTIAIVNAVRYKRYRSPAYSAAKAISLVSAVVSMLTLENAMLTAFEPNQSGRFHQFMLAGSGCAAILVVQGIAVYMIVNANRRIRELRSC